MQVIPIWRWCRHRQRWKDAPKNNCLALCGMWQFMKRQINLQRQEQSSYHILISLSGWQPFCQPKAPRADVAFDLFVPAGEDIIRILWPVPNVSVTTKNLDDSLIGRFREADKGKRSMSWSYGEKCLFYPTYPLRSLSHITAKTSWCSENPGMKTVLNL